MSVDAMDIKILKIHRLLDKGKVKAFVDISFSDALLVKGIRIVDGKKGLFVSMPTAQGKNERWYERVRCLNKEFKDHLNSKVLDAYQDSI